jgi:hypothetical protein
VKPGNGRLKGNAFERKVSKIIVAAFAHAGITSEHCFRTPGSGGHRYASKRDPGDLVLAPVLFKLFAYSVECKSYRNLDWAKLLTPGKNKGHFSEWWAQCVRAAGTKKPLLIFRQNRSAIFVMHRVRDEPFGGTYVIPSLRVNVNGEKVRVFTLSRLLQMLGGKV